jgi:DNA-binding transcriptional ArsR family regulator
LPTAQLDSVFSALADPTRRAILTRLASGEATVSELAEPFSMTLPAVSKHVKVLERAGLIERGREAQRRPCRLCPDPLREALGWLAGHSEFWEDSFDRLSEHLTAIQKEAEE